MAIGTNLSPPVWVTDLPVSTAREGGAPAQFRFRRTGNISRECTIKYQIGGSGASSSDVQGGLRTYQIVVPAGQSQTPILKLHATNDLLVEGNETCWVQMNSVSVGTIGSPNRRKITIVSDDLAVQKIDTSTQTLDTSAQTLNALTGTFMLPENAAQGAVAGTLAGQSAGSTLSIVDDAGGRVQLVGGAIQRGPTALDFEAAASHSFTVRETLAEASNSPRDTVMTLAVTDITEGSAAATVTPSANYTGAAGSGWTSGTPTPTMASPADVRALSAPARPALHPFFGHHVRFANSHRVYFIAAALDTDQTLLTNLGIDKLSFHYEGNTTDVTAPAFHAYTDVNGNSKTIYGWACDLVHNGKNGTARLYVSAHPRDGSKHVRTMGPYIFYPAADASQGTVEVAATPPEITGSRYKTLDAAAAYAQGQGWHTCILNVTETATYSPNISTGKLFANNGRLIIQGSAPFTIGGTGTVYDLGQYTSAYKPGLTCTKPRFKRIELRGSNCTLDMRFLMEIGSSTWVNDVFFNGCKITSSGGRGERWAMGPRQYAKLVHKDGEIWMQDCRINYVNDPCKEADSVVNCTFADGTGDIFTGTGLIYGNRVNLWGKDLHNFQLAMSVYYSGAGTPTLDYVAAASGRDIVLRVNGAEVGRYNILSGEANFLVNGTPRTANYQIAHLVSYINSRPDWHATVLGNGTRAQYFARLALGPSGGVLGAQSPGGPGQVFTKEPISKNSGSPTKFYTFIDMHSDWMAMQGRNENQISMNNVSLNLRGQITYWLGNPTGARDYLFINNIFHQRSVNVDGTNIPYYVNPPLQQITVACSHLVFAHNTYSDQQHSVRGSGPIDAKSSYSCNIFPKLEWLTASTADVASNHSMTGLNSPMARHTSLSSGGTKASLFVNADSGDFTPAGALLTNLKARKIAYDINGNERAPLDAAGAVKKP